MRTKYDIDKDFIYENDCPTLDGELLHEIWGVNPYTMRSKKGIDKAYKPDGITDNREEWRENMDSLKFWNETWPNHVTELQDKAIADSHDITKSNYGF